MTPALKETQVMFQTIARRMGRAILLSLTLVVMAGAASADTEVTLEVNAGKTVTLARPATTVFVANPEIADVQAPTTGASFFVFGKAPGRTSVFALGADGKPMVSYSVEVTHSLADLKRRLTTQLPDVQADLDSTPGGIVLAGTAPNPASAAAAADLVRHYLGKDQQLVNRMRVTAGTQVNLRVRIAEVSRTVTKELGFNWESLFNVGAFTFGLATGRDALTAGGNILRSATGAATLPIGYRSSNGRVDVNTVIDALAEDGLISILAEPNLTALSGETASFLAGGEFPIPVNQRDGQITIEFKQFGVSLDFTPSVLSGERISMKVRPEVSELTDEGAVMIEGLKIPALSVRRAETTVELGSGQSFAVAGLLQNNSRTVIQKVPGISDVPVLGGLFNSTRFQRNETELVIVVTPYLVTPVSQPGALQVANDGYVPASDLERIFVGRLNKPGKSDASGLLFGPGGVRLRGDVGFILD
jgi:pilus assembly protein CpaC